jgi:hypothetical protein
LAIFPQGTSVRLLGILLLLFSGSAYKLWFGARTQARADYELALTRLLLEETKQEFGNIWSILP